MEKLFISLKDWKIFLEELNKNSILYLVSQDQEKLSLQRFNQEKSLPVYHKTRALQPLKSFFFPYTEKITGQENIPSGSLPTILLGVKACDLVSLRALDKIFGQDPAEENYLNRRENTVIISSDCLEIQDCQCFCNVVDGLPYATGGFDLNLTFLEEGLVVEIGSEKGKKLTEKGLFPQAQDFHLAEREKKREKSFKDLREKNKNLVTSEPLNQVIKKSYSSGHWKEIARTCVECNGCRYICPTCNCFLMTEGIITGEDKTAEKVRWWDSCQSAGYARVAGGATLRRHKEERLRNFYFCKLVYRKEKFGLYYCTGCGRCIETCPGKIDIRETINKVIK